MILLFVFLVLILLGMLMLGSQQVHVVFPFLQMPFPGEARNRVSLLIQL